MKQKGGMRQAETDNTNGDGTATALEERNLRRAEQIMRIIENFRSAKQMNISNNTASQGNSAVRSAGSPTAGEAAAPCVTKGYGGIHSENCLATPKVELINGCEEALTQLESKFREYVVLMEAPERIPMVQNPERMNQLKADILLLKVEMGKLKEMSEVELCKKQRDNAMLKQEVCELKTELDSLQRIKRNLENVMALCMETLKDLRQQPVQESVSTGNDMVTPVKKRPREDSQDKQPMKWTKLQLNDQVMCRTNEFTAAIEVVDMDVDGDYLKLYNCTDHIIDLCLWSVSERAYNQNVTCEIFKTWLLNKRGTLTIWSQVAQSRNPGWRPDDSQNMTMTDKNWFKVRNMTITIRDGDRKIQAKCKIELFKDNSSQFHRKAFRLGQPTNASDVEAKDRVRSLRNPPASDSIKNVTYSLPPGTVLMEFPTVRLTPLKPSQIPGAKSAAPAVVVAAPAVVVAAPAVVVAAPAVSGASSNPSSAGTNNTATVNTAAEPGNLAAPPDATTSPQGGPGRSILTAWSRLVGVVLGDANKAEGLIDKDSCSVM